MKRNLLTLLLLCLTAVVSYAQQQIEGSVVDQNNEPLAGVFIVEKGTQNGTSTDQNGSFVIDVAPGATLVFSYIGFKEQEIPVGSRGRLDIVLSEDQNLLDEIVVVGYGTQKKSSVTASVSTISSKELTKQVTTNVASTLQGRAPGVEVLQNGGEAGGDVSILIRGAGTFGTTEPLYIIDGAVGNNGLNSLNPSDIQSIEILKDASASAIYGSRAANGVVLVTTKSGVSGRTVVDFNASYTYQTPSKKLKMMNSDQWREFANMVADNSSAYDRAAQNVNPTYPDLSTDWQDLYYHNAPQYNISAGISGGGEHSTFSTSVGYAKQDGIIIHSNYEKYNARINGTYKKGIFTVTENLSLAYTKKQSPPSTRNLIIPTVPVTDAYGRYVSTPMSEGYSLTNSDIVNPLASLDATDSYTKKTDVTGSLGVTAEIIKGLKYKINLSGSLLNTHGYSHVSAYSSYWDEDGNADPNFSQLYTSLSESRSASYNYTIDNLLTYNKTFNKHTFDALLGTSWMREFYRYMSINSGTADLGAPTITTYNGTGVVGSDEMNSALLSFFARLNYDYASRYLLSLSIRRDSSSKFADGYRVGYFPAISVGWNIHNEEFFKSEIINKLKIRASYGELGANFIDPYSFASLAYGPVPSIFGGTRAYGYVTRFAQGDLTWETAVSANVGLELGMFNDKLNFTAEYFWRKNKDLLAPLEPLPSSGQTIIINSGDLPYYNTASVTNKGMEFTLGYRNDWGDWHLDVLGNISFIKNNVDALGDGVEPIRGTLLSSKFNDRPTITKPGLPIGSFWGYNILGIDPETGDFLFEGADGSALTAAEVTEDDKQVLGNPTPDFTYGLNINLAYKNWDLTAFFNGSHGNEIFAAGKYYLYFNYNFNAPVDALDSWTPSNTGAKYPIAKTDNYNGGNALPSSFYVEDGSYLRLKNLQLGYTLPSRILDKLKIVHSARLYAGIQNLFTITKYSLYDPEVSSNTLFSRGVDGVQDVSPAINSRSYIFGVNMTF